MARRRVVVTGLGSVSPVGNTAEESWEAVKRGESGIARITLFDTTDFEVKIAGEVKGFDIERYGIAHRQVRKMARFSQFLLASSVQAVNDAGFSRETLRGNRAGIFAGNCTGGLEIIDSAYRKILDEKQGITRVSPASIPMYISNEAAANVSIYYGLQGPALTLSSACASSADAIAFALDFIRAGRLDVCLAGGTEAPITPFGVGGLEQLGALSRTHNDSPERASRPFSRERNGFVLSEGACTLVLEELSHAQRRGAKIYAELLGAGYSSDAYHITSPREDGSGAAIAAQAAIEDAGIAKEEVEYYNAHGTSTIANDKSETAMLKAVFGEHARKLHISSTKSMTGHLISAAGALEAMFTVQSLYDGFIAPTINLENPDIEGGCDLDYTPHSLFSPIRVAMSGSLGFGGHNSFLVFKKYSIA